jgi:hypothetical protein
MLKNNSYKIISKATNINERNKSSVERKIKLSE